mmetsp:Transcript_3908/g.5593  ORF Transcript_3908/g.5593 Transcript_3908/m.5593 type:complete len:346 (-) Transcript_3908:222-1259(-)|eukprot:CAMPEP_0184493816 /NCGR_PEP_ID=MMETSP0113_2-20130426/27026_1 /TAXON_ID=91329 /ORGANISM="Norrisiella sphaerica, Strain BC52" /LENGTH=345 /DNA_ID=CAMNT_0026879257 /DNA_START=65 /DNA_END=1102 /DNA_ORIENTATION=-
MEAKITDENAKKSFTDEDAKKSFLTNQKPVIVKQLVSDPVVFRSAPAFGMMKPPAIMGRDIPISSQQDPLVRVHPSASSSQQAPPLPKDINEKSLILFTGKSTTGVMLGLKQQLDKYMSEYNQKTKYKIEGKLLVDDELYEFVANLYSLRKMGTKSKDLGLEMHLLSGPRASWMRLKVEIAKSLGGEVNEGVKEFVKRYFESSDLNGDISGQRLTPNVNYVKSCERMVASGFVENQVDGLKGMIEVTKYCSRNSELARSASVPVIDCLRSATESKDSTIARVASDLLVSAAELYGQDLKISQNLSEASNRIRNTLPSFKKSGVEFRHIEQNLGKCETYLSKNEQG